MQQILRIFVVASLLLATGVCSAQSKQVELLRARHAELRRKHAETLIALSRQLEEVGAFDAAGEALKLAVPPDPRTIVLNRLPRRLSAAPSLDLPAEERALRLQFRKIRQDQSVELYLLSRQALNAKSVQFAYELLREAATRDPDNATARKVLGYVRLGDEWLTPFEHRMRRSGQVWHERFGWLPADHVARYEQGERFYNGRWMSAENEAELRRDFSNAWQVRTEHYLIKTNHSLERGVEVASRLETFHEFFVETFAGFFARPEDLQALFGGSRGPRAAEAKPYEVHYYRTREEYNQRLISKEPKITLTNGLYFTGDKVAYFFHDEELTLDDTLYHEATHQLMYESHPRHREVANQAHFWIVEGIACYMESFRPGEGSLTLGDPNHPRIRAARYRYLIDEYYMPLGRFASMGLQQFQEAPFDELQRRYSQASGLAHFFMHYDGGKYRDALIEHLAQLYRPVGPASRAPQNLAELTGIAYTELDRQYGEYMQALGEPAEVGSRR